MTISNVQEAEHRLRQAQAHYAEALQVQAVETSFGTASRLFAVTARVPHFGQFVSYSEEGVLAAVFSDEAEAERYAREMPHPGGKMLVVEPITAYL